MGQLAFGVGRDGVCVIDVRNPAVLGCFGGRGFPQNVYVVGDLAFVAKGSTGLQVFKLEGGPGFAPGILSPPENRAASLGATVTLQVYALGSEPLRYEWRKNGVALADGGRISGSTSAALTLARLEANDFASYSVEVSNQSGTIVSDPMSLTRDPQFRLLLTQRDLHADRGTLMLVISGASLGESVVLSSSEDLRNWLPLRTNVIFAGFWEAEIPWTAPDRPRFFRAMRQPRTAIPRFF